MKWFRNFLRDSFVGAVVAILVFAATFFIYNAASDFLEDQIEREFAVISEEISVEVRSSIEIYTNVLASAKGLFDASDFVSRDEWHEYISSQNIFERYPAIRALEYVQRVSGDEIEDFVLSVREEGLDDFSVNPAGQREEYLIVNYIEPFEGNERAFGFDLATSPDRLESLEQVRDTATFGLTSPIVLVQGIAGKALLAAMPVYQGSIQPKSLEDRRDLLQGYALAVIDARELLEGILLERQFNRNIEYILYDGEEEIFSSSVLENFSDSGLTYNDRFELGGRIWDLEANADKTFLETFEIERNLITFLVVSGSIFGVLLYVIFYLISRSGRRSAALAEKMTQNFNEEKKKVEDSNKNLRKALRELKKSEKVVEDRLDETSKLNKLMVDRELRMVELKKQIKDLKSKSK